MIPIQNKPNIVRNIEHTLSEIDNAVSLELCDSCINETILNSFQRGKSKNEHLWKAQFDATLLLDTNHAIYSIIYNFLVDYIAKTDIQINFLEPFEIKRYNVGDFFEPHRDNYFALDCKLDRKVNLILQLSDSNSYEGGDLLIGPNPVTRKKGSLIIFPSTYTHSVTTVTYGERYSLIGHAWGPNWI